MSNQTRWWMLYFCLTALVLLLMGGNATASSTAYIPDPGRSPILANAATLPHLPLAPAAVGMSDLMSQTFEFTGEFPTGWQTYSAISSTVGEVTTGDYSWSTTAYTSAEGVRSVVAMRGGLNGSVLTDTATFTEPVDSWLVYGPVSLASVWQAQLDWMYLYQVPVTASAYLTVSVSTDYDPISRTGTFSRQTLTPTVGWISGTLDLSPYTGQTVYVAFRYQSADGGTVSDGPFVDDVHLRANYRMFLPLVTRWTLTLSKSVSASTVQPGQSVVYSIQVGNLGNTDASGVLLTDAVPTGTTFVSADGTSSFADGVVTWTDLTVPAGGSIVQHMTVTIPSSASFEFTVVNQDYAISVPPSPMVLRGSPVTTTVSGTFGDDFSNSSSGWPATDYNQSPDICWPPPGSWRAGYTGGVYGVATACDRAAQLYPAPVRLGDTRYFTLEVDLRSNQADLWASSYGLFFNGIDDLHEVYTVELFQGEDPPKWELIHWPNFNWSDKIWPPGEILVHDECWSCTGADYAWNHMLVQRRGDVIEVWMGSGMGRVNLSRLAVSSFSSSTSSQHNRVGLYHGNFEVRYFAPPGSYAYVFDNFLLSPATR